MRNATRGLLLAIPILCLAAFTSACSTVTSALETAGQVVTQPVDGTTRFSGDEPVLELQEESSRLVITPPFVVPDSNSYEVIEESVCGVEIACVPGVDLRVTKIEIPQDRIPVNVPMPATAYVLNKGTEAPSQPVEVRICVPESSWTAETECASGHQATMTVPPIQPGQTVAITEVITSWSTPNAQYDRSSRDARLLAVVDPDQLIDDVDTENNRRVLGNITTEAPEVVWTQNPTAKAIKDAGIVFGFRIRNQSHVASSPSTQMSIGVGCYGGDAPLPVANIPALPTGGEYAAVYFINVGASERGSDDGECYFTFSDGRPGNHNNLRLRLEIDPSGEYTWGADSRLRASVDYAIVR